MFISDYQQKRLFCIDSFPVPLYSCAYYTLINCLGKQFTALFFKRRSPMRTSLIALFVLAAVCLCAAPAQASRPDVPAQPLEFKGANAKKAVMFNHKTHSAYDCNVCHHEVNGKESYAKCATAGCHEDLTGRKSPALYAVVHNRKDLKFQTCMSCHVKVAAEKPDQKKALTGCKGSLCHAS